MFHDVFLKMRIYVVYNVLWCPVKDKEISCTYAFYLICSAAEFE